MRITVIVVALALVAACDGADETGTPTTVSGEVPTTESPPATSETTTTTIGSPPELATDLMSLSEGTLFVSWTGAGSANPGAALQLIDGDVSRVTIATGSTGPVTIVFELPSMTTFDSFGVPGIVPSAGNSTFFGSIAIAGSSAGPDDGYTEIASGRLYEQSGAGEVTWLDADVALPVRWVRVTLQGSLPGSDVGERTRVELTEIIGLGTQEPQEPSDGFDGVWDLRSLARPDAAGERLELSRDGALISGCLGTYQVSGVVNGRVARATGVDSSTGETAALVLVAADGGDLAGVVSFRGERFESRFTAGPGRTGEAGCSGPIGATAVCEAPLYVNFARDSAEIRSESEQVLDDIYRVLVELGVNTVTVEGHTSTEGTDEHNQQLSEERARAVVAALVARGFPASGLAAVGLGETEPLVSPDDDEAARSINRRVELSCG